MTAAEATLVQNQLIQHVSSAAELEIRAESTLPPGVCGRLRGIALVYDELDSLGTIFAKGCLTRSAAERVPAGKVKLFADHGPFTHTHVGFVRSVVDIGNKAVIEADLFDTEAGRAMKEYLNAVVLSGASTGLSVGFNQRSGEWVQRDDTKTGRAWRFTECLLKEISITPINAVPGTDVTSIRSEHAIERQFTEEEVVRIRSLLGQKQEEAAVNEVVQEVEEKPEPVEHPPEVESQTAETQTFMSIDQRILAVRNSLIL